MDLYIPLVHPEFGDIAAAPGSICSDQKDALSREETRCLLENGICTPKRLEKKRYTLPETNSSPLEMGLLKRKVVFQPSVFRFHVSFREGISKSFSPQC